MTRPRIGSKLRVLFHTESHIDLDWETAEITLNDGDEGINIPTFDVFDEKGKLIACFMLSEVRGFMDVPE